MKPEYGDLPGWIESLATLFGFIAVFYTLRQAAKDRRSEQAGMIDYIVWASEPPMLTFGHMIRPGDPPPPPPTWPRRVLGQTAQEYNQILVTVFNSSRNAINDVVVQVPFRKPSASVSLGKIPPGEHTCFYSHLDPGCENNPMMPPSLLVPLMQFRDQNGRLWQRDAKGELTAIRKKRQELPAPTVTAQLKP